MSTILELIHKISQALLDVYDDPLLCEQYAWWTLESITKKSKTDLLVHPEIRLSSSEQQLVDQWLYWLIQEKKPIQYLIGMVPFGRLDILVKPPVLIPRPETEEWCLNLIHQLHTCADQQLMILDLCCGTGCIALTCAKALPHSMVYATDISDDAVDLTQKNCAHNNINNVHVLQSDLFTQLPSDLTFDLIVSNPPYIAAQQWENLDESVTAWEDRQALIADNNGLAIIEKIVMQAPAFLKPYNSSFRHHHIPQLVLEIDATQGNAVKSLMESTYYDDVHIHKDLEGKDRVVSGRVKHVASATNK